MLCRAVVFAGGDVPHLVVYTAFFYYMTGFFAVAFIANITMICESLKVYVCILEVQSICSG